jgi:hypothetical protein
MGHQLKKKHIEVYMGQYKDGAWFASSCDIPWIAAEGDSCTGVMLEINQIVMAFEKNGGQAVAFPLAWRSATEVA